MYGYFSRSPRSVQTTIPCERCEQPLSAQRGCQEVTLRCAGCGAQYPLTKYSQRMDEALEQFLENVYCDRM
ncbi:dual CXXC motif small (seleno)protein [Megalodesulfovibrio paquesii]